MKNKFHGSYKVVSLLAGAMVILGEFEDSELDLQLERDAAAGGTPLNVGVVQSDDGFNWEPIVSGVEVTDSAANVPVSNTKRLLALKVNTPAGVTTGEMVAIVRK